MKRLLMFFAALLLALANATEINAQSGDAKYEAGVAQYKKGNMQAAIKLFSESKILDKSAANKKRCNAMIARCKKPRRQERKESVTPVAELSLNRNYLDFDGKQPGANVVMVEATNDWTAVLEDEKDADWCILEKSEDRRSLVVRTNPSLLTVPREAVVKIADEDNEQLTKSVTIRQGSGKTPLLVADPEEIDRIDVDGDEVLVKIDCVSDTLYSDGKKWMVKNLPDWVSLLPDKQKEQTGLGKIFKSKKNRDKREPLGENELSLKIAPNKTKDERTGYIVVESQRVEVHVKLKQKRK